MGNVYYSLISSYTISDWQPHKDLLLEKDTAAWRLEAKKWKKQLEYTRMVPLDKKIFFFSLYTKKKLCLNLTKDLWALHVYTVCPTVFLWTLKLKGKPGKKRGNHLAAVVVDTWNSTKKWLSRLAAVSVSFPNVIKNIPSFCLVLQFKYTTADYFRDFLKMQNVLYFGWFITRFPRQ